MEVFGFLIIVGLIWIGHAAQKEMKRNLRRSFRPKGKRPSKSYPPRPKASPRAQTSGTAPRPFDPRTASEPGKAIILEGRASIVDGDTLKIKQTQIRLFGIDAPELNHPYGQKAKWALVHMCKGQEVTAKVVEMDKYGRTVARCRLSDGRDLSAEMVKQGLAIDWPKYSNGLYRALEVPDARRRLWLADARQKGRMHVWRDYEARRP